MSTATLVLGDPGSGKSTSMRNLDPGQTMLIQTVRKPLPFRAEGWSRFSHSHNPAGNIVTTDRAPTIIKVMENAPQPIIVLDDWNLLMTNEFMRKASETGYQKFSDIGRSAWEVLMAASSLAEEKRVYILGHLATDDTGTQRAMTIGRMLDEKCPVESLFTIVLKASRFNGNYLFQTQSSGRDTCKSPIGLFEEEQIDNDLAAIDAAICEYYQLAQSNAA